MELYEIILLGLYVVFGYAVTHACILVARILVNDKAQPLAAYILVILCCWFACMGIVAMGVLDITR